MLDVGSKQERKKNPFDPIGNPVFFFTKAEQGGVSLDGFAKRIEAKHEERLEKARQLQQEYMMRSTHGSSRFSPVKAGHAKTPGTRPQSGIV
jgi:hypothetical protein